MDIRCRKTKCLFNDRYTCRADGITISSKMLCTQFEKTEKKEPDMSKRLFERTVFNYAPYRDRKDLAIGCKAPCVFNADGVCRANGITVNALKEKPYCMTYVQK